MFRLLSSPRFSGACSAPCARGRTSRSPARGLYIYMDGYGYSPYQIYTYFDELELFLPSRDTEVYSADSADIYICIYIYVLR